MPILLFETSPFSHLEIQCRSFFPSLEIHKMADMKNQILQELQMLSLLIIAQCVLCTARSPCIQNAPGYYMYIYVYDTGAY